jgi:hypothetical protein
MISSASTSISASATSAWLAKDLASSGLSADKAKVAASDLLDAAVTSLAANPGESDGDFRTALVSQIDQDVSSGKLSQDDADSIKKWLDQTASAGDLEATGDQTSTDGTADPSDATSSDAAPSDATRSGDAAASGSLMGKTEVSRMVTVSGSIKTTMIAYSDGSSETETTSATASDDQKHAQDQASTQSANDGEKLAMDYLSKAAPGTFINKDA